MTQAILARLSRITSSGAYIPEIDALRFIAIALVVIGHIAFYVAHTYQHSFDVAPMQTGLIAFITPFGNGVQLFFVISGFILAVPFAAGYLRGGAGPDTSAYLFRRVTRLEPPYLLAMVSIALLLILVKHQSVVEVAKHLGASLLYSHAFIYGDKSTISFVTWSLEIEVQFYLLMPILANVYRIHFARHRRALLIVSALAFISLQMLMPSSAPGTMTSRFWLSLPSQIQYFLAGMYLADIYVEGKSSFGVQNYAWDLVSLAGWPIMIASWRYPAITAFAFPFAIVLLYCAAFRGPITNRIMRNPWAGAIGGMCYTIYLLHLPLISFFGPLCRRVLLPHSFAISLIAQTILICLPTLVICSFFFIAIEKPCMNKRWPEELRLYLRRHLRRERGMAVASGA